MLLLSKITLPILKSMKPYSTNEFVSLYVLPRFFNMENTQLKVGFLCCLKGYTCFPQVAGISAFMRKSIRCLVWNLVWGVPPRDWIPSLMAFHFIYYFYNSKGKNETSVCWEMQLSRCNSICGALYRGNHLANSKPGIVHNCIGWQRTSSPLRINSSLSRRELRRTSTQNKFLQMLGELCRKIVWASNI